MPQTNAFSKLINDEKPVLIDFHATWCGPCKTLAPIIQNVKQKIGDKARIVKIDIDKNPELSQTLQIKGVPTLILYKNGAIKWRQSGVLSEMEILKILRDHI